jgi:hypothetical protein
MKWMNERRRRRARGSVKLEDDVIDIVGEEDIMITSAELDMIELISEDDSANNKESRRLRRSSRAETDQNIEEFEVFPVEIMEEKQIKKPLGIDNQIICPSCNSRFGISIGVSSTKCPVCEERIDL